MWEEWRVVRWYPTRAGTDAALPTELDRLRQEGWEIVGVTSYQDGAPVVLIFIGKRVA